jgi:hypothetical protein
MASPRLYVPPVMIAMVDRFFKKIVITHASSPRSWIPMARQSTAPLGGSWSSGN